MNGIFVTIFNFDINSLYSCMSSIGLLIFSFGNCSKNSYNNSQSFFISSDVPACAITNDDLASTILNGKNVYMLSYFINFNNGLCCINLYSTLSSLNVALHNIYKIFLILFYIFQKKRKFLMVEMVEYKLIQQSSLLKLIKYDNIYTFLPFRI